MQKLYIIKRVLGTSLSSWGQRWVSPSTTPPHTEHWLWHNDELYPEMNLLIKTGQPTYELKPPASLVWECFFSLFLAVLSPH